MKINESQRLIEERAAEFAKAEAVLALVKTEERDLSPEERSAVDTHLARLDELDADIARVSKVEALRPALEQRAAVADAPLAPVEVEVRNLDARVKKEPLTYDKGNGNSYVRDLIGAKQGDFEAMDRLRQHNREVRAVKGAQAVESRAISTSTGAGGDFAPPLWVNDMYAQLARAGRPLANVINRLPLPMHVASINIPKVATGTATAVQQDGGTVQNTDLTSSSITVPIVTVAGQQVVSQQLYDRAVPGIDEIVFADLIADYNAKLDAQLINGSAASGQARGIFNVTGVGTSTVSVQTVVGTYPKIADAIQQVASTRFLPADLIVMHPRRWGFFEAALDSSNRPLVVPAAGAYNPMGLDDTEGASGIVGSLQGLPVLLDANLPINLGAGTNEDWMVVTRRNDLWLWEDEGGPRARVLEQTNASSLQLVIQVFGYFAFTGERYPKATALVKGSTTPTF